MFKKWKYQGLHIPGGPCCQCADQDRRAFVRTTFMEMTELAFYKQLSNWNQRGQGHWVYWAA